MLKKMNECITDS